MTKAVFLAENCCTWKKDKLGRSVTWFAFCYTFYDIGFRIA